MPLQATSGAATYDAFGGGVPVVRNYIEDVFSTYLYTGNSATQTINNGIDLAGKGGLVWGKSRNNFSGNNNHYLEDTNRGPSQFLFSNFTNAQTYSPTEGISSFNANGFSLLGGGRMNASGDTMVSWTFRKQPKFFDVVTYTGNDVAGRTVAHSLGSVPGCIIVKRTDANTDWAVYHRSLTDASYYLRLNQTSGEVSNANIWNSTAPTSTVFTVGTDIRTNVSGGTYVAYIFAHDAGGFGPSGNDNVISCGSFTADGNGNATVNLGYEPQFWLYKPLFDGLPWTIYDIMRGWSQRVLANLNPNVADAEGGPFGNTFHPTATGFDCVASGLLANTKHIYIAIRRGPMKVPTDGTKVFNPAIGTTGTITTGFPVDMQILSSRDSSSALLNHQVIDRLRGVSSNSTAIGYYLNTTSIAAEGNPTSPSSILMNNVGFQIGNNYAGGSSVFHSLRRAPGFFDVVCYSGTGLEQSVNHNLGVIPELAICKSTDSFFADFAWYVQFNFTATTYDQNLLNSASAANLAVTYGTGIDNLSAKPTANLLFLGPSPNANNVSQKTYVYYLFASAPGVSKVGSYIGTGATLQVDCGFTGGARFVLIKRTNSTGDWYVWDSARGIVAGNDPYLLLNSTAAEVTTTDYVNTFASGFEISSAAPAAINANGGTFIFLAIA